MMQLYVQVWRVYIYKKARNLLYTYNEHLEKQDLLAELVARGLRQERR